MSVTSGTQKYGMIFPAGLDDLTIELWAYAHDKRPENTGGRLTKWQHFKNVVDMLWNHEHSSRRVIWNAWTERMLKAMVANRYVGLAGCGSSGKSDASAVFALVEWIAAPTETLCLITSTTLAGARKRVWKSVTELWNALETHWKQTGKQLFGKMVQSRGMIVGLDANGMWSEALGLTLVAADQSSEAEASKKLKGLKAPAEGRGRLRLIADELSDLGFSVLSAGIGNLNTNPDFKMIGMSNPTLKLDPFGQFCEPKEGWKSVTALDEEWETRFGICIRFDATRSPRITEENGDELYKWMPGQDAIDQARNFFGEGSREFWAQVKGMWCPEGLGNMVWTESELEPVIAAKTRSEVVWDETPVMVAGLDPSFTTGGDGAIMVWGLCGRSRGKKLLQVLDFKVMDQGISEASIANRDPDAESVGASLSVIRDFRDTCKKLGVRPDRAGCDNTGGGVVFLQWMHKEWSPSVRKINFGAGPEPRSSAFGQAEDVYGDRVSQLWCQPKQLVRQGQIIDIPYQVVEELCQRKFHETKSSGGKLWVEPKKEMKKRIGRSPDHADAFVVLVETCVLCGLLDFKEIKDVSREYGRIWRRATKLPAATDLARKLQAQPALQEVWVPPTPKKIRVANITMKRLSYRR